MHTHYEGVGIAGPVTAAGYPDFYVEYHTLCGSGMYGHFVSILCHGIFERFPDTKVMMVEGGLVPFVGLLWRLDTNWKACRSEIPWCRKPPSEYVWDHVRFSSQPLETPEDPSLLAAGDPGPAAVGHALLRERLPALGLRRARPDAAHRCRRSGARTWPGATRRSSTACPVPAVGVAMATTTLRARRACRSAEAPAEGERRLVELGGHRSASSASTASSSRSPTAARTAARRSARAARSSTPSRASATRARVTREGALVRCPWHKWDFDIATGRCAVDARLRVRRYPCRVEGDELVVSLDASPAAG